MTKSITTIATVAVLATSLAACSNDAQVFYRVTFKPSTIVPSVELR